ncbi:MAG: leucine-rich repeat domain-containing protein, partial [Muribaculaceae bacterium]|nr:leucine-rich repeat domain-containing protein [Muribaculaceae bacterium]
MKNFFLLLAVVLLALPSLARDFEYNGLTYTVLDEDARTCETKAGNRGTSGNHVEGDIVIPDIVYDGDKEYSVTSIGGYSFCYCYGLTSIKLPELMTEIGESAFSECIALSSVELGNSVTEIGTAAFFHCVELTSIVIPDSVVSIGDSAFAYCEKLASVKIGDSVTEIGDSAFRECIALSSVEIGNSVT